MEEKNENVVTTIKDTTANPAPLGLLGFGMTTVLLNIHNTGYYTLGAMILAMGIFYGGMAQIFAGWMEWKKATRSERSRSLRTAFSGSRWWACWSAPRWVYGKAHPMG